MNEKFLRLPAVIETTGLSRSEIYRRVDDGKFPKPVKPLGIGTKPIAFLESEIQQWMRDRIADARGKTKAA